MPVARRATAVHRVATSIKIEAETHATVRCGLHAREVSARGAPRRQPRAALAPPPPRAQPVAAVGVSRRTVDRQKNSLGDRARVIKLCSDLHGLGARGLVRRGGLDRNENTPHNNNKHIVVPTA